MNRSATFNVGNEQEDLVTHQAVPLTIHVLDGELLKSGPDCSQKDIDIHEAEQAEATENENLDIENVDVIREADQRLESKLQVPRHLIAHDLVLVRFRGILLFVFIMLAVDVFIDKAAGA